MSGRKQERHVSECRIRALRERAAAALPAIADCRFGFADHYAACTTLFTSGT